VEAACRDRATGSAHQHHDIDPAPRRDEELSIAGVARRLGVKPDVIYSWAQWGHLPARRGDAGRLWIDFTPAVEHTCLQRIASSYKLPADIKTQAAVTLTAPGAPRVRGRRGWWEQPRHGRDTGFSRILFRSCPPRPKATRAPGSATSSIT